jgi:hypothetical protein
MDFFEQQEHARRQTRLLLIYFAAAVVVIVVLTYLIFAAFALPFLKPLPQGPRIHNPPVALLWLLGEAVLRPLEYLRWTWEPRLFAEFATGAALTIALGSLYKIRQLTAGGPVVAELLGGRRVEPDAAEPDEQQGIRGLPLPDRRHGPHLHAAPKLRRIHAGRPARTPQAEAGGRILTLPPADAPICGSLPPGYG